MAVVAWLLAVPLSLYLALQLRQVHTLFGTLFILLSVVSLAEAVASALDLYASWRARR